MANKQADYYEYQRELSEIRKPICFGVDCPEAQEHGIYHRRTVGFRRHPKFPDLLFACDGDTRHFLVGAVLCLAVYFIIRRIDDRHKEKIEQLAALLKVYQNEIKAWEGDFSPLKQADSI